MEPFQALPNKLSSKLTPNLIQSLKSSTGDQVSSQTGELLNSFSETLQEQLSKVNQIQHTSEAAIQNYAAGGDMELHQVMMAATKAEMAMDLTVTLRNKIVHAYQEISRMQV